MEQNFQTSFIPKKPMVRQDVKYSRPIGFFTVVAFFVLLTVVLVTGALYFYKGVVTRNIQSMANNLKLAKERFEPAKITELQTLDKRLHAANEVLRKHIVISPIFEALQSITMKTVRYTKFDYSYDGTPGSMVKVHMSGVSLGYSHLALQSDLYGQNKHFIDPVFSHLTLNEAGQVLFDLDFAVDPSFVDYKLTLETRQKEQENANPITITPLSNLPANAGGAVEKTTPTAPAAPASEEEIPELPDLNFPDEDLEAI